MYNYVSTQSHIAFACRTVALWHASDSIRQLAVEAVAPNRVFLQQHTTSPNVDRNGGHTYVQQTHAHTHTYDNCIAANASAFGCAALHLQHATKLALPNETYTHTHEKMHTHIAYEMGLINSTAGPPTTAASSYNICSSNRSCECWPALHFGHGQECGIACVQFHVNISIYYIIY